MFPLVITIHVIACVLLILIVLVQQGRGGGLIDTLSSAESIFGTKTSSFLVKSTSVLAVVFFLTCLGLAFLSIQKSKSLLKSHKVALQEVKKEGPEPAALPAQQEAQQAASQPSSAQPASAASTERKAADADKQNIPAAEKTPSPAATTSQPSQPQQPLEKIQN